MAGTRFPSNPYQEPFPGLPSGVGTFYPNHPAGAFNGHASLTDSLVSYWPLSETSGSRLDVVGSNHLSDNNSVGSATPTLPANFTGPVASFVRASDHYLSLANQTVWTMDVINQNRKTLSLWVNFANFDTTNQPLGFFGTGDVVHDGSPAFLLNVDRQNVKEMSNYSGAAYTDSSGALTENTWYHVVTTIDYQVAGAHTIRTYVNTAQFIPDKTCNAAGNQTNLYINGGYQFAATCYMAHIGIWNRMLSSIEISDLFSYGAGRPY